MGRFEITHTHLRTATVPFSYMPRDTSLFLTPAQPKASAAVWVASNSPGFHEIDIMALVKRWKADGHLSAVMKDATGPRAREVLERKACEHKVSFLQ